MTAWNLNYSPAPVTDPIQQALMPEGQQNANYTPAGSPAPVAPADWGMNWGTPAPINISNTVDTVDDGGFRWFGQGGAAPTAVKGLGTLMNGWLGMKQLDLAKKQLRENKRQFDMNWGAQKNLTNSQLRDRQAARVASNPGAYQSVGEYMKQNGVQ